MVKKGKTTARKIEADLMKRIRDFCDLYAINGFKAGSTVVKARKRRGNEHFKT